MPRQPAPIPAGQRRDVLLCPIFSTGLSDSESVTSGWATRRGLHKVDWALRHSRRETEAHRSSSGSMPAAGGLSVARSFGANVALNTKDGDRFPKSSG